MKIEESHGIVFLVYTNVANVDFRFLFLMLKYWSNASFFQLHEYDFNEEVVTGTNIGNILNQ